MILSFKHVFKLLCAMLVALGSTSVASAEGVGQICKLNKDVNLRGTARGTGAKIRIKKGESFEIMRAHASGKRVFFEGATGKGWIHSKRVTRICKLTSPKPAPPASTALRPATASDWPLSPRRAEGGKQGATREPLVRLPLRPGTCGVGRLSVL